MVARWPLRRRPSLYIKNCFCCYATAACGNKGSEKRITSIIQPSGKLRRMMRPGVTRCAAAWSLDRLRQRVTGKRGVSHLLYVNGAIYRKMLWPRGGRLAKRGVWGKSPPTIRFIILILSTLVIPFAVSHLCSRSRLYRRTVGYDALRLDSLWPFGKQEPGGS